METLLTLGLFGVRTHGGYECCGQCMLPLPFCEKRLKSPGRSPLPPRTQSQGFESPLRRYRTEISVRAREGLQRHPAQEDETESRAALKPSSGQGRAGPAAFAARSQQRANKTTVSLPVSKSRKEWCTRVAFGGL